MKIHPKPSMSFQKWWIKIERIFVKDSMTIPIQMVYHLYERGYSPLEAFYLVQL